MSAASIIASKIATRVSGETGKREWVARAITVPRRFLEARLRRIKT